MTRIISLFIIVFFTSSLLANPADKFQEFTTEHCLIRKVRSYEQQVSYAKTLSRVIGNSDTDNQEEAFERNKHGYYNPQHISVFGDYLIYIKGNENPIGTITFVNPGHTTQFPAHTEAAIDILEEQQRKGFGSEVFKAFCLKFEKLIDTKPDVIVQNNDEQYQLGSMQIPFKGLISFVDALSNYASYKLHISANALPIGIRGSTICCVYPATSPLPPESIQALSNLTKKIMTLENEPTTDPNMWLLKRQKEAEHCAEEWRILAAQKTDLYTRFMAIKHLVEAKLANFDDYVNPQAVKELLAIDRAQDCYGTLFSLLAFLKYRNNEIDSLVENFLAMEVSRQVAHK